MATFEFSPVFEAGTFGMNGFFISPTSSNANTTMNTTPTAGPIMPQFGGGVNGGLMYFHIMKGTVPTDPDTLTSFAARSADVLITWQRGGNTTYSGMINPTATNQFSGSSETNNPCSLTTSFQAASASGTATWFWWATRAASNSNGAATDVVYHSIIGTVGATGSGSDLEIGNTSITSGKLYRLINFRVQLPLVVTY